ncbi:MAG: hypothetical protein AAGI23_00850 [Bacteroidota bacterium]
MQNQIFLLLLLSLGTSSLFAQSYDYPVLYRSQFNSATAKNDFTFTDPSAWRINTQAGTLELFGKSQYQPRVRSPRNIALYTKEKVGSFVLMADVKQTGREYGHRDMCFFFGAKDASNFYYIHVATKADQNAHNIFLVNDEARRNIADTTTEGVDWGSDWHRIKIIRDIDAGTIEVYFDDMQQAIMTAQDKHFDYGYVGFGSFDDTGMVDNVVLQGKVMPTYLEQGFFPKN